MRTNYINLCFFLPHSSGQRTIWNHDDSFLLDIPDPNESYDLNVSNPAEIEESNALDATEAQKYPTESEEKPA